MSNFTVGREIPVGPATAAESLPITVASDQTPFGIKLYDASGNPINLGQALRAASIPVTVASDQTPFGIKLYDASGNPINLGQALRAASIPVTVASDQTPLADYIASGALTAPAQAVTLSAMQGVSDATMTITGTWTGSLQLEGSNDGTNYTSLEAREVGSTYLFSLWATNTTAARVVAIAGFTHVRLRAVSLSSGSASVTLRASAGSAVVSVASPIALAADSPSYSARDAFQRFRVGTPQNIFDSKQIFDGEVLLWDNAVVSGSGTSSAYSAANARTRLSVSNTTAGMRARQTFRWFNYQPGKSQLINMTFTMGSGASGITRRVGLFETNNGVFFQQAGTTLSVNIRTQSDAGNQSIAQSSWNIDRLDGTGPSRVTLDITKSQILVIDFQWLGVGAVRFGFFIDGIIYYVHQFRNANKFTSVYMSTPNLPLRYEISNDGTGPAASFDTMCSTVISEGGRTDIGQDRSIDRGASGLVTVAATLHPLLCLQLQSGRSGAATGLVSIALQTLVGSGTQRDFLWQLLLNPTFGGTALPSYVALPNSSLQAITNTVGPSGPTITAPGTVLASGYYQQLAAITLPQVIDLQLGTSIAGTPDTLVLAVQQLVGSGETVVGSLGVTEFS